MDGEADKECVSVWKEQAVEGSENDDLRDEGDKM